MSFSYHLPGARPAKATEFRDGRWFIVMGFAGFNSPANNRSGYPTMLSAYAAIRRYENAGRRTRAALNKE